MTIRVALVEDDEGIRESLANLISRASGLRLVSSYRDAETALRDLPTQAADVALVDINLPGLDGVECVRQLKPRMSTTHFVMLTVYEDNERLFRSLQAGASGYLLKRTAPSQLLAAIREVHAGGSPMTPQIARRVVQYFQFSQRAESELDALTPRERVFLEHLAQGYRYKEITERMGISMDTVRSYVRTIYEKLHVHSRTEAVVKYLGRPRADA